MALLLCGPQSSLPSTGIMRCLHQVITSRGLTHKLLSTITEFEPAFQRFVGNDPQLANISGVTSLGALKHWLESGQLPVPAEELPNHVSLPLTILLQISLYLYNESIQYSATSSDYRGNHHHAGTQGVLGFCIGFLTAAAIAFSANDDELAHVTSTSLRLAICIGAYIDANAVYANPPNPVQAVSVRWKQGPLSLDKLTEMLADFPQVRKKVQTKLVNLRALILSKNHSHMSHV